MSNKLVNCKACNQEIGKGVKKCPNCGTDQRNFFGKHKIITGILVIVVLVIIGSALGKGGDKTTSTSAPATTANTAKQEQPKPAPLVVTADKLVEDLKNNALSANENYNGKYVELTGQLSNIDSSGKYFSLSPINDDFSLTSIMCYITEEQKATVAKFTNKQKVTVIGTITDIGEVMGYTLKVESIK